MLTAAQIEARFHSKLIPEPNSGCWIWTACLMSNGYGIFTLRGRNILAHRFAYELHRGSIPEGLQLDHLCRVRCCVNPEHLEPVTVAENLRRGIGQKPHEYCRRGHVMTPDNIVMDSAYIRRCAICSRAKNNAYYARKHNHA